MYGIILPLWTMKEASGEQGAFAQGHQLETGQGWQSQLPPHIHSVLRALGRGR